MARPVVLALLAVGGAAELSGMAQPKDLGTPQAALAENDECAGAEGQCGLNALQLKAAAKTSVSIHRHASARVGQSPFVSCDPSCSDEGEEDELGVDAELGGSRVWHYAQNCWHACGGAGPCPHFCGPGNACCRWGFNTDPGVCHAVGFWPVVHMHTCVHPHVPVPAPAPQPGNPSSGCSGRAAGGQTTTLYHQTGCDIGPLILSGGFKLGSHGWCGGAIYFATAPAKTETKAIGEDSHKGFMIEAQVMLGNIGSADKACKYDGHVKTGDNLFAMGYDSTRFNPGDGDEYVVYCSSQVVSMKQIPWTNKC